MHHLLWDDRQIRRARHVCVSITAPVGPIDAPLPPNLPRHAHFKTPIGRLDESQPPLSLPRHIRSGSGANMLTMAVDSVFLRSLAARIHKLSRSQAPNPSCPKHMPGKQYNSVLHTTIRLLPFFSQ